MTPDRFFNLFSEVIQSDIIHFLFIFALTVLCITFIARLILGKNSGLEHAIASSLAIITFYALCVVIYTFDPVGLKSYLTPLPFVVFIEEEMTLFDFATADFTNICVQLLSMVLLAYLINQINSFTPANLKVFGWMLYRLFCLGIAFFAHYLLHRIIGKVVNGFIPNFVIQYTPMILLGILVFMFSLGFIKFLVGLIITVTNPFLGGIYAFFFANKIGKNLSRAIGSTFVLTFFVIIMHRLGYDTLPISPQALDGYLPFAVCFLILWVIIGHKM